MKGGKREGVTNRPAFRRTWFATLLLVALGPSSVARADQDWHLDALLQAGRAPLYDLGPEDLRIETRFGYGLNAWRRFDGQAGRWTRVDLGVMRERFPDADNNDRLFYDAALLHAAPWRHGPWDQFRFAAEARHARDPAREVYSRIRLAPALRLTPAPRQILQFRTRFGYREQNDANTFPGYDQSEYLLDMMHLWRGAARVWRSAAFLYVERRSADADRFSYDEAGTRLALRRRLDERTELVPRVGLFSRHYDDGERRDRRLRLTLGLERTWSERLFLNAYLGYQTNLSTVSIKDYRGTLAGLELRIGLL
ncbi:hypothetical protein [Alloalcanivorax marinus]|uniref:hypothetical protein n=1 Tax=Alloalcanivorax marinus TaxID=1177169 RepID=UPI0019318407|nr:hypothetical protein [Alloalcanivorax marinus]MBL7250981.1 hypothetical protein [Alloalcanivorax marinus]